MRFETCYMQASLQQRNHVQPNARENGASRWSCNAPMHTGSGTSRLAKALTLGSRNAQPCRRGLAGYPPPHTRRRRRSMCIKPTIRQEENRQSMRNNNRSFGSASQLSSLAEDKSVEFNNEPSPSPGAPESDAAMKRVPSSIFHGAGDSGVWPGQAPSHGAIAFITPLTMAYIVIWYVSGAFTNSSSKQTLQHFDKNFLSLTLMQHASAAICGSFAIRVLQLRWGRLSQVRASAAAPWRHRAFARVGGLRRAGGKGH